MPKRSKSSERWLQRQRKDYFVRKAQDGGQVSRAHYKLAQIDQRFHILSARKKVYWNWVRHPAVGHSI